MEPFDTLNLGYGTPDDEERIASNREVLFRAHGISRERVVSGWLTHGKDVAVFRRDSPDDWPVISGRVRSNSMRIERMFRADGVISNVDALFFLLTFADCVPILFADRTRGVIGAAHAGWRGTAQGIAFEVVRRMQQEFGCDPADIIAGIGPSIGPCCYSMGSDVATVFSEHGQKPVLEYRAGETVLDLWSTNERQLVDAGILSDSIENPRICTRCNTDTYFSHRGAAGRTGRFSLMVGRA